MERLIDKYRKDLSTFSRNSFFAFLLLLILNKFTSIIVTKFLNLNILLIIIFFFGFSWFFFHIRKNEPYYKKALEPYFKYSFLILLFIITIGSFQFSFLTNISWFNSLLSLIKVYQFYLVLLAIGFGFFTFYFNREVIDEVDKEKDVEVENEEERKKEFSSKFPRINKIPVFRNIVKWMYKEGWWYSVGLMVVVTIGLILRVWKIGNPSLWVDEIWHTYSSYIGLHLGNLFEAFKIYKPAPIVTFIVYSTGKMFGLNSEAVLRLPFAIIGTFSILLSYFVGKIIHDKKTGLILSYIIALSPIMIQLSRDIRFYSLIVLSLLSILILYYNFKRTGKILYLFLLSILILLILVGIPSYLLIIIPFLIIDYVLYKNNFKKIILKNKSQFFIFILLLIIISVIVIINYSWMLKMQRNYSIFFYIEDLFIYEFFYFIIAIVGLFLLDKGTYAYYFFLGSMLGLSLFAPLQQPRYFLFVIVILYLLTSLTLSNLLNKIKGVHKIAFFCFLLLIVPAYNFINFQVYPNEFSLGEHVSLITEPHNLSSINKLFDYKFFDLERDWANKKPNYKESLIFIDNNRKVERNKVKIIAGDPESLRYYNRVLNYNFRLIHYLYPFEKINKEINDNSYEVYAILDYKFFVKRQNRDEPDDSTKEFILSNMTLINDKIDGIYVYKI